MATDPGVYQKALSLMQGEDVEQIDPRVQVELEKLNLASEEINKLENELDEARTKYRMTFAEASGKMTMIAKKSRKSIQKSREYYELNEQAKLAQAESLKAARQYQSAISVYRAAKETVTVAEDRLAQKGEVQLSSAWQEMMNHATIRLMEAETEKRRSQEQHMVMTSRCAELEHRLKFLERKFKQSIAKARPYFETKQQLDIKLQQLKQNVSDLQTAIKTAKTKYSGTLKTLESISEEIHESRRGKLLLMFPRQPGVGAESDSVASSLCDLSLDAAIESNITDGSCDTEDENEAVESENTLSSIDHLASQDRYHPLIGLDSDKAIQNQSHSEERSKSATKLNYSTSILQNGQCNTCSTENQCETALSHDDKHKENQQSMRSKTEITTFEETPSDSQLYGQGANVELDSLHRHESERLMTVDFQIKVLNAHDQSSDRVSDAMTDELTLGEKEDNTSPRTDTM